MILSDQYLPRLPEMTTLVGEEIAETGCQAEAKSAHKGVGKHDSGEVQVSISVQEGPDLFLGREKAS